ncbi:MAG: hypothetical protein K2X39_08990 [Silvanigrellaceae bacterium]|nr:hypothetical protein [Silvanigrellaceae bacterium]
MKKRIEFSPALHKLNASKPTENITKISPVLSSVNKQLKFKPETLCETIYYNRANERCGVHSNRESSFTVYSLPNLLALLNLLKEADKGSCKFSTNKIRYLVTTDKQLFFALEGTPNAIVPAHYQMSSETIENAKCLAAGNIYLTQDNGFKIKKINHKSGDFTPCFDSIKWVLALLLANESLLQNFIPETIEIEELDVNGGQAGSYFVTKQNLAELLTPHIQLVSTIPPCTNNRMGRDYNKYPHAPYHFSRLVLEDSFAGLNLSSGYESQQEDSLEEPSEILDHNKSLNEEEEDIEYFSTPIGSKMISDFWKTSKQKFNVSMGDSSNVSMGDSSIEDDSLIINY